MGTFWILVSLIIFVCILLVLVVMVQNPKGGGFHQPLVVVNNKLEVLKAPLTF